MKSWKSNLLKLTGVAMIVGAFALPQAAQANDNGYIEIIIGGDRRDRTENRVERLERAVRQLQNRVVELETEVYSRGGRPRPQRGFVCSLKDDLHGKIFLGRGNSVVEAEARAQQACIAEHGFAMWCDGNRPSCDRE